MAVDKKITELTALTGASIIGANDVLPIVDIANDETKKITANELRNFLSGLGTKTVKTGSYTILTTDLGNMIELGATAAGDKTFTLPSVGSDEDGLVIWVANDSFYTLTLAVSDTDHVWNSGAGYGVEMPDKGTIIAVRYQHSQTKWDIIYKTGGKVLIEGLVLYEPMSQISVYAAASAATASALDRTETKTGLLFAQPFQRQITTSKFPMGSWEFNGADEYLQYSDSADWDVLGIKTGDMTIGLWVYHDAQGSAETYLSHFEDANNEWRLHKTAGNLATMLFDNAAGVADLVIDTTTQLTAATWHHIVVVRVLGDVGIYLNGVQEDWAANASWTVDTLSGVFAIARYGGAVNYHNGRLSDLHISYNNPYGAAPNVGVTDTFTVPAAPFQGVM